MKLTTAARSITIESDAAATTTEPSYSASYVDNQNPTAKVNGDSVGPLTGTTPVTVVAAPHGQSREVEAITVYNRDTVSHTITAKKVDGATGYALFAATLGAGESMAYDGKAWAVYTAAGEVKASTLGSQSSAAGTKNGSTVSANESGSFGDFHKTVLTCVATPLSIADDAGVAQYGGVKVYSYPEGAIKPVGAVIDGAVTLGATGTIINAWAGGVALGTAAAGTGATLVGTEADIMAEVDVAAATAKVAVVDAVSATDKAPLDGTAAAKDVYLNLVVDDDATHTAGTGTFTGTITITWIKLGDK